MADIQPFNDVTSKIIRDNDTWNTCPTCQHSWRDDVATPGLIHRTKKCTRCVMRKDAGRSK